MVPSTTLVVVNASSVRRPWPRRVSTPIATPSGTAMSTAARNASSARDSVAGSRCAITSATGSWEIIEVPRSPVKRSCR